MKATGFVDLRHHRVNAPATVPVRDEPPRSPSGANSSEATRRPRAVTLDSVSLQFDQFFGATKN